MQIPDSLRKTYIWTLVNRKVGIVIFFYENCEDEAGGKHEGTLYIILCKWRIQASEMSFVLSLLLIL